MLCKREVFHCISPTLPPRDFTETVPPFAGRLSLMQALVDVLVPILQPQLPQLPRHMLQRLLQAAADASVQLPASFLAAWAAAAAAPAARGSWEGEGPAALLDVSLLLVEVRAGPQQQQQQQQQQMPVQLPLQWCAYALEEACQHIQQAQPQLLGHMWGDAAADEAAPGGSQEDVGRLQEQLAPVLLAACGHQLQQQQLLWRPWGHSSSSSSSSSQAYTDATVSVTAAGTEAWLASVAQSLQQLLGAASAEHDEGLQDIESALLPGLQQRRMLQSVLVLLAQQQAAAVALIWSWLAFGGGAQNMSSDLLRTLLEQLPYDDAAAAYTAAIQEAAAAGGSAGSSDAAAAAAVHRAGKPAEHSSLLEHVLHAHTQGRGSAGADDSTELLQLESVSGLLGLALQIDVRAAFAALPSLLSALPHSAPAGSNTAAEPSAKTSSSSSSNSSTAQQWDAAVVLLCDQLQHMLQLGPQQLLSSALVALKALTQLSTAPSATPQSMLCVLQLAQQLADAADSWHDAAASPQIQEWQSELASVQLAQGAAAEQQVPTAAEVVECCWGSAPLFAQACSAVLLQQDGQQLLPRLAELLQAAAALQDTHGGHRSLQPDWLPCRVAPPSTSAAGVQAYSSSSSSGSLWAPFEPVLLATAAQSGTNALDAADVAAAASALLQLGLAPSEQLLQAYWDALDPEALGLTAVGLQQLLWITAALVHQQQQQTNTAPNTAQIRSSMSSSSSSGSHMLRLATKACSSLSVRSASALSARQAARVTWALASLGCSDAAAAAGWTPPQQILSWLRRVWQGMDAASGRSGTSSSSSRFGASADGVVLGLQAKVLQLQDEHNLHQQEAGELQWALQQLRLLPQQADAKSAQAHQQQQQQQELQDSPALAEVRPQQQQDQAQENQQQHLHEQLSTLHKHDEQLLHTALQEGGSQQTISAKEQQEQQQQGASNMPQQPLQSAKQHLQQQQQQQRPSARPLPGKDAAHRLLQQQQLLRQGQAGWDQSGSKYAVHDFAAQRSAPAAPARATSAAPPQPAAAGHPATAATVVEVIPSVVQAAAAPGAAGEADVAQVASTVAAMPSTPAAPAAATAAIPQAAEVSTTDLAPHQQDVDGAAAAGANADSADVATADAPAAAAETAESASTAALLEAAAASPPAAAAAAAPESSGVISAAAGAVTPVPPSVAAALQQLRDPSFNLTQKQAMQLLLPVQQHLAALSPSETLLYAASCFKHKVPMCSSALLAVGTTAAAACTAAQAGSAGQGYTTEVASAPASLLLQLLSATAAAIAAPVGTPGAEAASEAEAAATLKQRAPHILQQLLPALGSLQLVVLTAPELLQLLRDVFTTSTGQQPPKATVLPVGATLFGPTALSSNASSSNGNGAGPAVELFWLKTVSEVLQRKLLLFPHGSQLLQSLQLLQALGLRPPSSSFMASFLEAADALLDTLSGRNCLELLAAVAAAGTLPSKALGAALLQHLVPLKLPPTDVAAGCRLLAALSIRPSAELLLPWFDITEAAAEQLQPSGVLQMLWACCVWQVQPPTTWLEAVVKSLLPVGRLTSCSPATLAGLCRCMWQLGVQPAPGFVAAVAAAAEYSITAVHGDPSANSSSNGSSSSGSWAYWQQGRQQHGQPEIPSMDAESLSVLCYCFHSWQHSGTPTWRAAVAERAAALMDSADGMSVLRLALYLGAQERNQEGLYDDAEELLPWQQTLLTVLPQLLQSTTHAAGQEVILTADAAAEARRFPAWALVVLSYVLSKVPEQSLAVLRGMIAAIKASSEQELLTSWDVLALWSSYQELLAALQHSAETASGPLAGVQVNQLQQEAEAVLGAAQDLLKYAYQQRAGAPADVLEALPVLAADFGIDIPQQSRSILQAAVAAARQREEQLQQALLLQEQGGPAVPESLLQGLSELNPDDGDMVIAQYANSPLQAALGRRLSWLGAAVSNDWVVRGLSNA